MRLHNVTLVTGNKNKAKEFERILEIPLEVVSIDLPEIQSLDLEEIALDKVNKAFEKIRKPVFVDDVSVEIEAWEGFPGPLVKWMLKVGNNEATLVLKLLTGERNRRAKAKLAVGFHDGRSAHVFIGEVKGRIAEKIRGSDGFGWDPIFIPEGKAKTYAEMKAEEKDSVSHRGVTLKKVKDFIKKNYEI